MHLRCDFGSATIFRGQAKAASVCDLVMPTLSNFTLDTNQYHPHLPGQDVRFAAETTPRASASSARAAVLVPGGRRSTAYAPCSISRTATRARRRAILCISDAKGETLDRTSMYLSHKSSCENTIAIALLYAAFAAAIQAHSTYLRTPARGRLPARRDVV